MGLRRFSKSKVTYLIDGIEEKIRKHVDEMIASGELDDNSELAEHLYHIIEDVTGINPNDVESNSRLDDEIRMIKTVINDELIKKGIECEFVSWGCNGDMDEAKDEIKKWIGKLHDAIKSQKKKTMSLRRFNMEGKKKFSEDPEYDKKVEKRSELYKSLIVVIENLISKDAADYDSVKVLMAKSGLVCVEYGGSGVNGMQEPYYAIFGIQDDKSNNYGMATEGIEVRYNKDNKIFRVEEY